MRREVYLCDICGRERGPENHWFVARLDSDGQILFQRWGYVSESVSHLCSEDCCHKLLSRFLSGGKKEVQA